MKNACVNVRKKVCLFVHLKSYNMGRTEYVYRRENVYMHMCLIRVMDIDLITFVKLGF